jgi:CRISPR-associated protein Csb1
MFLGGYNIDLFPDGTNVCLVDSVGSQANRIEPIFAKPEYAGLVPQVNITAGEKTIRLLDAGHRAGDAIVRCSELKGELQAAFKEVLKGNAEPMAKIAPTSLVFGVWDSRDTEAKLPRLLSSTIRAFNVKKLTRSANYLVQQQLDYTKEGHLPLWRSDKEKELYSKRGFLNALASASHGGVQLMKGDKIQGSIRRDATLGLAALRRLAVLAANGALSTDQTQTLRRYILGLALVALMATQETYLRQGCNLVPADEGKSRTFEIVHSSGKREPCQLTHDDAKKYAQVAAQAFGAGGNRQVAFDKKLAENDIKGDEEKLKGEVASLDLTEKKFKLTTGKGRDHKEIDVTTNDGTTFMKGKEASTFDQVVVTGAKLDVEVASGVAVKVTGKK